MRGGRLFGLLALALLAVAGVAQAASGELKPFGYARKAQVGVRFCPTETLAQRVPPSTRSRSTST
jgi:hypothetical protein